jgi:phosphate starvation-inducible PhoH-like protein
MSRKKTQVNGRLHIDFINTTQKLAYGEYQQHDILILLGPAGTGKTFLASAFAIKDVIDRSKKRIVLTRPIVEAGEKLGFLPGTFEEKINPYIIPVYDCMRKLMGCDNEMFESFIKDHVEVAPLAYMRGRSFDDSVCIFDEAQNATHSQLKLFLTRFGKNSKIIITGDPKQSDIYVEGTIPLMQVVHKIQTVPGISTINFGGDRIVRHPLIAQILNRLEE